MKYLRLVSSAKSVKISWLKYLASKAHGPLSSLAVTASAWDGLYSHVESGLWKSFFFHKISLFFGSTLMEVVSQHLCVLWCCQWVNHSPLLKRMVRIQNVFPRPIHHHENQKYWCWIHLGQQQSHRFTFCGAHTFLDSSLNALPCARDEIFPATSGADVRVVNGWHATGVQTSLPSDLESERTARSTCWVLNHNLAGRFLQTNWQLDINVMLGFGWLQS